VALVDDTVIAASLTTVAVGLVAIAAPLRKYLKRQERVNTIVLGDPEAGQPGIVQAVNEATAAAKGAADKVSVLAEGQRHIIQQQGAIGERQNIVARTVDALAAKWEPNGGHSLADKLARVDQVITSPPSDGQP